MLKITVDGKILECKAGDNLYQVITQKKISIRASCGGVGACGDCVVKVLQGEENLSTFNVCEKHYLGNVYFITKERLSCQCVISGAIEVSI